MPICCCQL